MTIHNQLPDILHVDNNQDFLDSFRIRYKHIFSITSVCSGEEALKLIKSQYFDVIITDYEMPGINGLELLKILRDEKNETPVIFFTGQGNEQIAVDAFVNGAEDYFTKDMHVSGNEEKLVQSIKRAVETGQTRQKNGIVKASGTVETNGDTPLTESTDTQLKLYDQFFYNIFQSLKSIRIVLNTEGKIVFCNDFLLEFTGKKIDEYLGKDWFSIFIGREKTTEESGIHLIQEVISNYAFPRLQSNIISAKGEHRLISWIGSPVYEDGEEVTGILVIGEDITEKIKIERQLIQERNLFIDGPAVVFKWTNKEGWPVEYVSPNVEEVMGWSVDDLISGRVLYEKQILPEDIEKATMELLSAVEENLSCFEHSPYRIKTKDGRIIWLADYTTIIRDENGEIIEFLGYVVDISNQINAEEKLLQSNTKWKAIFDSISDCITLIDSEGTILRCNKSMKNFLKMPKEEIIGKKCRELFHYSDELPENCPIRKMQVSEKRESLELEINNRWFLITVDPIFDDRGKCIEAVHIMTDITQRKQFEKILMEKNRELNDFAHRVSHNMKNYIFNLNGYISAIKDDPSLFGQYYGNVLKQTENLTSFINRLLALSRAGKTVSTTKKTDINDLLRKIFYLVKRDDINTELKLTGNIPHIQGDPESMEELFMNLMENSIKYRNPEEGKLIIEISHKKEGNFVWITLKDNGMGIEKEYQDKVFSPGYTLHKNKGTGFGMTIAKKITEAHNGSIHISSEGKNRGTTVSVKLPVER